LTTALYVAGRAGTVSFGNSLLVRLRVHLLELFVVLLSKSLVLLEVLALELRTIVELAKLGVDLVPKNEVDLGCSGDGLDLSLEDLLLGTPRRLPDAPLHALDAVMSENIAHRVGPLGDSRGILSPLRLRVLGQREFRAL
jgi:hypothetical protein